MTGFPTAADYIRAVQQPDRVFGPPELRAAAFETHPLYGIPMPASGNAAVVFRAGVGGVDTALRFFLREDAPSRARYTALGAHFAARGLADCVASPVWVDDAITVNGAAWPVVRMGWVDGRTLDAYVAGLAAAGDTDALTRLAAAWRELVRRLQAADFAHGDLQHGNVLIDMTGTLRLVDFDGSWIASFAGSPPPRETGHPNYQRTGREWGRWMDTFPGLVVYTALLALARRPEAWAELHTGENLLFSAEDFAPPFRTGAWELLAGVADPRVVQAAEQLRLACAPGWRATGTLESVLERLTVPWWELTSAPAAVAAGSLPPPPPKSAAPPPPAAPLAPPARPAARAGTWYAPPPPPPPPPAPAGAGPGRRGGGRRTSARRAAGRRIAAVAGGLVAFVAVAAGIPADSLAPGLIVSLATLAAAAVILVAWPRR
jgi:eukaryotic-like serine/threonine-protein kinase